MPMTAATGLPCRCSGTSSSAGAVRIPNASDSSSGASCMTSRYTRRTSAARSIGKSARPPRTSGPTGCSSSSSAVTTPKLPPPPRIAQSSSGCSSSDARTTRPSQVTSSAATRLSHARPCLRSSQPEPPPSVSPATPVVDTRPPVVARPWLERRAIEVGPDRAAAHTGDPAGGVDLDVAHRPQVEDDAVVAQRQAGDGVAAGAHGDREVVLAGEGEGGDDVLDGERLHDVARTALDHRVEQRAAVVVGRAAGLVDAAVEAEAQLVGARGDGDVGHGRNTRGARRPRLRPLRPSCAMAGSGQRADRSRAASDSDEAALGGVGDGGGARRRARASRGCSRRGGAPCAG